MYDCSRFYVKSRKVFAHRYCSIEKCDGYHAEETLVRLFELRDEVRVFLIDNRSCFKEKLIDELWLIKLAYLVAVFSKTNEVNLPLQGKKKNVFIASEKYSFLQ